MPPEDYHNRDKDPEILIVNASDISAPEKKDAISQMLDIDLKPEMKIAVKSEDFELAAKLKNEGERRGLDMTI